MKVVLFTTTIHVTRTLLKTSPTSFFVKGIVTLQRRNNFSSSSTRLKPTHHFHSPTKTKATTTTPREVDEEGAANNKEKQLQRDNNFTWFGKKRQPRGVTDINKSQYRSRLISPSLFPSVSTSPANDILPYSLSSIEPPHSEHLSASEEWKEKIDKEDDVDNTDHSFEFPQLLAIYQRFPTLIHFNFIQHHPTRDPPDLLTAIEEEGATEKDYGSLLDSLIEIALYQLHNCNDEGDSTDEKAVVFRLDLLLRLLKMINLHASESHRHSTYAPPYQRIASLVISCAQHKRVIYFHEQHDISYDHVNAAFLILKETIRGERKSENRMIGTSDSLLEIFSALNESKHFEEVVLLFQLLQRQHTTNDNPMKDEKVEEGEKEKETLDDVRLLLVIIDSLEGSANEGLLYSSIEENTYMMISLYQRILASPMANPRKQSIDVVMRRLGMLGWMEELVELLENTQSRWGFPLPNLHPMFFHSLIISIAPSTSTEDDNQQRQYLNNLIYLLTWMTSHSQKPSIIIFTAILEAFGDRNELGLLFQKLKELKMQPTTETYKLLIDAFRNVLSTNKETNKLFGDLIQKDDETWRLYALIQRIGCKGMGYLFNMLIRSLVENREEGTIHEEEILQNFERMKKIRLKVDKEIELVALRIYLKRSRREEALRIFYYFLSNETVFNQIDPTLLKEVLDLVDISENFSRDSPLLLLRKCVRDVLSRTIVTGL